MAWPDNTPVIDTTNFLNDSGTVTGATGARNELVTLINRLNQALDSIDAGDTPYTDNNSADLMKKLAVGTANDICLLNSNGYPIRAAKTISTSVNNNNNTVPTGAAVQTYVGGITPPATFNVTGVCTPGGTIYKNKGIGTVDFNLNASQPYAVWTINFSTPFTNDDYLVLLTPEDSFGQYLTVASTLNNSVTIHDFDADAESSGSGSSNSSGRIHIAMIGDVE